MKLRSRLRARQGDSVAVNGVCLTVTSSRGGTLGFDVSPETLRLTTLGALRGGDRVNVEPALRAGDLLGGHLISGHVDDRATVLARARAEGFTRVDVSLPRALRGLVARKGSIAVEGVSLTVNAVTSKGFSVMLIPETLDMTTLGRLEAGDKVNLEADLIARYVQAALYGARRP